MSKPKLTPEEARKDHWQMLRFMALIGALTAIAIIWLDIGGIGARIDRAANPVIPILLLVAPFSFVFGGVVTASALLTMPYEKKFKD
jgi:hypothetical protein